MHWVLQTNIFREQQYDTLIDTLTRFEMPWSEHKVVPFVGTLLPADVEEMPEDLENYIDPFLAGLKNPVICMGAYSMRHSAKKFGWNPGVFDLEHTGQFSQCMKHWGSFMLNSDSVVMPFKDVRWASGERFVRPVHDTKVFAGKVYEADEFNEWRTNVCVLGHDFGTSLTPHTLIQVAEPKVIYAEYRCWIVAGNIVTMSLYKRGDRVMYQNMDNDLGSEAARFATQVLKTKNNETSITLSMVNDGWHPDEAFCLDVCETSEGWRVVEVNTINSCGFYAANLTSLVLALDHAFGSRTNTRQRQS